MYFDGCPVIKIDAITYPVTLIFDPPAVKASTDTQEAETALMDKIASIVGRILSEGRSGAILVFLPGERAIKDCIERLSKEPWYRKLFILPLYGRLSKEEQERVFKSPPFGKKKIVISTNIAETSITINDIAAVIDSGLAKLNFYNPFTFTSSLDETLISKASCNQRRGRAGRTQEGVCYRLYTRKDFETRQLYTLEEIYRTDLSEVVMRMAELGILDFENFDFISPPGKKGIMRAKWRAIITKRPKLTTKRSFSMPLLPMRKAVKPASLPVCNDRQGVPCRKSSLKLWAAASIKSKASRRRVFLSMPVFPFP